MMLPRRHTVHRLKILSFIFLSGKKQPVPICVGRVQKSCFHRFYNKVAQYEHFYLVHDVLNLGKYSLFECSRVYFCKKIYWYGIIQVIVTLFGRYAAKMEEGRSAFKILIGKPTGNNYLERLRRRQEENIRIDFQGIGINTRNWVDSAQDRDY